MGRPASRSRKNPDAEWFNSTVAPTESIKKYLSAPPKGMTNPPQNPEVRAALLQDIKESGLKLEYKSHQGIPWPPPAPNLKRSRSVSHSEMMSSIMNSSMRSSRSFGSTAGAGFRSRSMASTATAGSTFASTSSPGQTAHKPRKPKTTWKHIEEHIGADPELDSRSMSQGNGTCRWRTAAAVQESRRRAEELAELKALRASGPFKQKIARVMEDREIKGHVEVLKAQSGMHKAMVGDRFRFSSDTSAGAPMVISGSGAETAARNDIWRSDLANLLLDHNGAMRLSSPNALQPSPEDTGPKHGKKKKKKEEDNLDMGAFKPLYPLDNSLRALRRIKKKHFPEPEKKQDFAVMKAPTAEEKAAEKMKDMGGLMG